MARQRSQSGGERNVNAEETPSSTNTKLSLHTWKSDEERERETVTIYDISETMLHLINFLSCKYHRKETRQWSALCPGSVKLISASTHLLQSTSALFQVSSRLSSFILAETEPQPSIKERYMFFTDKGRGWNRNHLGLFGHKVSQPVVWL